MVVLERLRPGDVVLQVDGFDVSTVEENTAAIRNRELGSRIELTVARAGQQVTLSGPYVTQLPDSQVMSRVRQLAERGEIEAEFYLGYFLAKGQFTVKDDGEAVPWFRKAAEKGHAAAQNSLGWMYHEGRGVAKDDTEAVAWIRKVRRPGERRGAEQSRPGCTRRRGDGVVRRTTLRRLPGIRRRSARPGRPPRCGQGNPSWHCYVHGRAWRTEGRH